MQFLVAVQPMHPEARIGQVIIGGDIFLSGHVDIQYSLR